MAKGFDGQHVRGSDLPLATLRVTQLKFKLHVAPFRRTRNQPNMRQRRPRGDATVALLLAHQVARAWQASPYKPAVTVAAIALMAFVYYESLTQPLAVCIEPHRVLRAGLGDFLPRAFASALTHGDTNHLYYNMLSFLHKGVQLESLYGTPRFAVALVGLILLCNVFYVLLGLAGEAALGVPTGCAVGWSAVIFALKVMCQAHSRETHEFVQGLGRVPAAAAAWAELFLISLATPNASFTGHLAGILAGLAFVAGERALRPRRR